MTNAELLALSRLYLPYVRNYLDITWADPEGDEKLVGIIARGILYIERLAGDGMIAMDDDGLPVEGKPVELLYDYCRYVRSNALNEFESNYLAELNALQLDTEVSRVVLPNG